MPLPMGGGGGVARWAPLAACMSSPAVPINPCIRQFASPYSKKKCNPLFGVDFSKTEKRGYTRSLGSGYSVLGNRRR